MFAGAEKYYCLLGLLVYLYSAQRKFRNGVLQKMLLFMYSPAFRLVSERRGKTNSLLKDFKDR